MIALAAATEAARWPAAGSRPSRVPRTARAASARPSSSSWADAWLGQPLDTCRGRARTRARRLGQGAGIAPSSVMSDSPATPWSSTRSIRPRIAARLPAVQRPTGRQETISSSPERTSTICWKSRRVTRLTKVARRGSISTSSRNESGTAMLDAVIQIRECPRGWKIERQRASKRAARGRGGLRSEPVVPAAQWARLTVALPVR